MEDYEGVPELFHLYSEERRLNDLIKALNNDQIEYIWSFRGGYGAQKLIPYLNKLQKPKKPKILIGYSDFTALHLFVHKKWGWKAIHGAMVASLTDRNKNPENFRLLQKMIQNPGALLVYEGLIPLNEAAKNIATVQGKLTGGNLRVFLHTLKDANEIETKDKIVIFEDINAECYYIDQMLQHMVQVGKLTDAKAIIIGEIKALDTEILLNKTLNYCAQKLKVPVFRWKNVGMDITISPLFMVLMR